jgi:NAD(P)-dependent dehydrogenase (short-subunit alcohol dehydrogenase family)
MNSRVTSAPAELFDLTGRTAVVTGGSRGLGRQIAFGLAAAGADVMIASRTLKTCELVATEVRALGRRALAYAFDAGRWDECGQLVRAAYEHFGQFDILVNNAGFAPLMPVLEDTTETQFDQVLAINFKGPFRLAALFGARMAAAEGGSIINIGSDAAFIPDPPYAVYGAAKRALTASTRALARAYAPKVRVNALSPGYFATDMMKMHELAPDVPAMNALGRAGRPAEIVSSVLYLSSRASSYTTGGCLHVNGGLL